MLKRLVLFCVCAWTSVGSSLDVALTLDDYPMAKGPLFSAEEKADALLKACDLHRCKAVFFCIGMNCEAEGASFLKKIEEKGHFLANHSFSHQHFSEETLSDLQREIQKTESILSPYRQARKWFRYPFLDYGDRKEIGGSEKKAFGGLKFLSQEGYVEGYVTINTFDWYINDKLIQAIQKGWKVDYDALKSCYLSFLQKWCDFYAALYRPLLPSDGVHTLLLHANDLNALYLSDVLQRLQEQGWRVVSPEKAFTNTKWRQEVYKDLSKVLEKPPSMSLFTIDEELSRLKVFSRPSSRKDQRK